MGHARLHHRSSLPTSANTEPTHALIVECKYLKTTFTPSPSSLQTSRSFVALVFESCIQYIEQSPTRHVGGLGGELMKPLQSSQARLYIVPVQNEVASETGVPSPKQSEAALAVQVLQLRNYRK